ncbi:putative kinesin family protein [Golovinomyces cichoracearum]|uniref:Putative kinesin family protein n=1 Tax=Golovinomyces cichoracearum TaxID=62708 RepID=A0A420I4R4_9PEZI|nr:putative kinesin family protein [Golovinomyces cichoracearum]
MASSPPGSPLERPPRPVSALTRPPRASSRMSMASRLGEHVRSSDDEPKSSVKVVVRVRPPLKPTDPGYELIPQRFHRSMVQVTTPTNLVIDSPQGRRSFTFDRVFEENIDQGEIWDFLDESTNAFVQGYNVSMLAYGQSGAGKSYTMGTSGPTEQANSAAMGVIPRAAAALFEKLEGPKQNVRHSMPSLKTPSRYSTSIPCSSSRNPENNWTLKASYVEIYNEQLRDLLVPESIPAHERQNVLIREDVKGHIILSGLYQVEIHSVEDMMSTLNFGSMIRQTDSTAINAKSSRSHAVFSLNLVQHKSKACNSSTLEKRSISPTEDENKIVIDSKFHFVDLAGSERLKNTGAQGERAKEGISINAGLASLGKVISQLSCRQAGSHVSYRDSKLTRLLQDSLGGNAITYMIACVTPIEFHLSETLNTLQYAQRARAIQSKPTIQQVSDETDNLTLIKRLKSEVAFLRDQIRTTERTANRHNEVAHTEKPERPNEREVELQNQLLDAQENYTALSQRHAKFVAEIAKSRDNELTNYDILEIKSGDRATERLERSTSFAEAVEQVVLEYERTIQSLEQSLSTTRNSLSNTENFLLEKETKCSFIETLNQQLQARLQKLIERESSTENYLHDLEAKLDSHTSGEEKNSAIVKELRKEIARVRENEAACEDYISTLEERLVEADQDAGLMQREIDRLEHVIERQRSIGKLDCLLYELDHIQNDGSNKDEIKAVNGDCKQTETFHSQDQRISSKSIRNHAILEVVEDDEFAVSNSLMQSGTEGSIDHDESNNADEVLDISRTPLRKSYHLPSPAQSKFVEDKLENISQELFDLRVEHESTINEYDILSTKYEESLRLLAELQDNVDSTNNPGIRNSMISEFSETSFLNPAYQSDAKIHDLRIRGRYPFSPPLSSELSLVEDMPPSPAVKIPANEPKGLVPEGLVDVKTASKVSSDEVAKYRKLAVEQERSYQILAEKFMQLEKEHICALELVEELKSELAKAKMMQNENLHLTSPIIRRKSSQNVMIIDKAHRAFASLRNIGSESFESEPDKMANFELNLNTAMHELHARSERVQELEADVSAAKKEIESKMTIISGLTRERSSLQSPIDISVVTAMSDQLLRRENQIKEAHESREQELLDEIKTLQMILDAYRSTDNLESDTSKAPDEKLNFHQQKIADLEVNLINWQTKHKDALKKLKETRHESLTKIAQLEAQNLKSYEETNTDKIGVNYENGSDTQEELFSRKSKTDLSTEDVDELEKSQALDHQNVLEITKSRDEILAEIEDYKSLVANLEKQISEHDKIVESLQHDHDFMCRGYSKYLEISRLSFQKENEAQLSEIQSIKGEDYIKMQSELTKARNELAAIATQVVDAIGVEISMEELPDRISHLLSDRNNNSEESELCNKLKNQADDLSKTNSNLTDQINSFKADISNLLLLITDSTKQIEPEASISDQLLALKKEINELSAKNEKNSRLVQELEDQLATNYDQHQVFNNRLSNLQSEHSAQIEESNLVNSRVRSELEKVKEEYLSLQAKLNEMNNLDSTKVSASGGHLIKSPSVPSLPSPPPAIPLPPLPATATSSNSSTGSISSPSSSIPGQSIRPSSKELAAQQIHEDQEARIRTIEKHLSAEKQLTHTLEEALTDLEKQSKKLKSDVEAWKKRCLELEIEMKQLKEKEKSSRLEKENRWSLLQVEEERKKRRDAEIARGQLEERMNAINKKKKKASLNCF